MVRVLLIEDKLSEALRMKSALEELGHSVTHVTGASELNGDMIVSFKGESIFPGDYDVALVDAALEGQFHGWHFVPPLIRGGVMCIAISAGGQFNPMVQSAGAQMAMPKEDVVPALQEGRLNLNIHDRRTSA